jgi:hypothetical protein
MRQFRYSTFYVNNNNDNNIIINNNLPQRKDIFMFCFQSKDNIKNIVFSSVVISIPSQDQVYLNIVS